MSRPLPEEDARPAPRDDTPLEAVRRLLRVRRRQYVPDELHLGDPIEVLVRLSEGAISVEVPVVEWHGPHTPVRRGEAAATFPATAVADRAGRAAIKAAVAAARAVRLGRFRTCAECGERQPPEWMHGEALCQSCAERNHGVCY